MQISKLYMKLFRQESCSNVEWDSHSTVEWEPQGFFLRIVSHTTHTNTHKKFQFFSAQENGHHEIKSTTGWQHQS